MTLDSLRYIIEPERRKKLSSFDIIVQNYEIFMKLKIIREYNMKINRKFKIISLMLAVVMVLAVMPVWAIGDEAGVDADYRDVYSILKLAELAGYTEDELEAKFDNIVASRQELAERYASEFRTGFVGSAEYLARKEVISNAVHLMMSGELCDEIALSQLEEVGIIKLDSEITENFVVTPHGPQNVHMRDVMVSFDSWTGNWLLMAGGWWLNDNWRNDQPSFGAFWREGDTRNIGGLNGIGIRLFNTSNMGNTRVVTSEAYVSAGGGQLATTFGPSNNMGSAGVYFQWQSYAKIPTGGRPSTSIYFGRHFSAIVTYCSNFADARGLTVFQYDRTWGSTTITSVSAGAGTSVSFSIGFSHVTNRFTRHSAGQTRFG